MSTSVDYLCLNKHKLFENLRKSIPDNIDKTQNLLTVNDGVLFTWDFQDQCVLTLNIKETHYREDIPYQILLPTSTSRFPVELLRVNSFNTLLLVAGSNGILVLELPERCPPHGAFANNKEMVYCRSYNLDEQLLMCSPFLEVRQVRFHPASQRNTHILALTCDNTLRLYNIENSSAFLIGVYSIGQRPKSVFPGSKTFFLGFFGETAVDFDFGPPELSEEEVNLSFDDVEHLNSKPGEDAQLSFIKKFEKMSVNEPKKNQYAGMQWPIFLLGGLGLVNVIKIDLNSKSTPKVKGPLPIWPAYDQSYSNDACSIICQPCIPPILCIATINGSISHSIVLPIDSNDEKLKRIQHDRKFADPPDRAMYVFECLELELGLATSEASKDYACPVFLHQDQSRMGHYFATHEGGVHSITMPALDALVNAVNGPEDDSLMQQIVSQPSSANYLLCTRTSSSKSINPVIGFGIHYDPTSSITLLAKGQVVTTVVVSFTPLPLIDDFQPEDIENFNSPLKKMLSEPFDLQIHKILKQTSSQPILKLSAGGEQTPQECYNLLQRATQIFRKEHFKNHEKAREEIEKRIKVLQMLKRYQTNELQRFNKEKQLIQKKAESLAEKYEDIKDKQEDLKNRCEKLLILVSQKNLKPSEAENKFVKELKDYQEKIKMFEATMSKLKNHMKYQEVQMDNWKNEQNKKETGLGSIQSKAVKSNLLKMTGQIADMTKEVNEYKKQLGL